MSDFNSSVEETNIERHFEDAKCQGVGCEKSGSNKVIIKARTT